MFKALLNKLFGIGSRRSAKIKSIRKTFESRVLSELDNRMIVHDERVYDVPDLEWIHGICQVLLEEELSKKFLEQTQTPLPTQSAAITKDGATGKKQRVYH